MVAPTADSGNREKPGVGHGVLLIENVVESSRVPPRRSLTSPADLPQRRSAAPLRRRRTALRKLGRPKGGTPLTLIWFVVWLIWNVVGDNESLAVDPVNWWTGTLILAVALDLSRQHAPQLGRTSRVD